jgi:asparagine synthase (glutamine-hydrolysing)
MCGIAGFVGNGDRGDLGRMSGALRHRGPDGCGEWQAANAPVYLAVRRLAVVDLGHAAQPFAAEDESAVLAFNGEIYNHTELRRQLQTLGARFVTDHSDTEVLLHGYRQWGTALTDRLNGMWAFAIYDPSRRRLFLSRDRFGQKPLFYSRQNGTFAFASELTSLLEHGSLRPAISALAVQKYFAYGFIPAPYSLYENVHKVPAGCNVTIDVRTLEQQTTRYWDFVGAPIDAPVRRIADVADELRALLLQAVARQMQSDVPVGVFLSGGIDSSAIAYFAARANRVPVKTFSIGFEDGDFDESRHAARVAAWLGAHHTAKTLDAAEARRVLPDLASRLDEPICDGSMICTHLLCETARPEVTVALGGEGADELFAGYDPFRILSLARWYSRLMPRPVHHAICLAAAQLPSRTGYMSFDYRLTRLLRGLTSPAPLWNPAWIGALAPDDLQACFTDPVELETVYAEAIQLWDSIPNGDLVEKTRQFYVKLYFQDDILTKVDRAGMLNSLEVRSPFLDLDLIDFVRRLPTRALLHRGQTKYAFKEAMRSVLPAWIVDRTKHGFAVPMARWLHAEWLQVDGATLPAGIDAHFVRRKIEAHRRGRENNAVFLWGLWLLAHTTDAAS